MRLSYYDIRRSHRGNPDCPMRLMPNGSGGLYCLDCGAGILMTGIEVEEAPRPLPKVIDHFLDNGWTQIMGGISLTTQEGIFFLSDKTLSKWGYPPEFREALEHAERIGYRL